MKPGKVNIEAHSLRFSELRSRTTECARVCGRWR